MITQTLLTDTLNQHTFDKPETAERIADILSESPHGESTDHNEQVRRNYQMKADLYNESVGDLDKADGIDCPLCKNRGYIEKVVEGFRGNWASVFSECECNKRRKSWRALQRSGLAKNIDRLTFDKFDTEEDWQKRIKMTALKYIQGEGGEWFFIGGSVGCGKTHICTAICGEYLKINNSVKYMCWAEEAVKLKSKVNDEDYGDLIREYKECDVLYIDDFFKTRRNRSGEAQMPTDADIKLAYQIINYRYVSRKKTIISSEWMMDELMDFDEATSSRIYEMSKRSTLNINRQKDRNYRRKLAV